MQVKKQDIKVGKAIFEGEIKSGAEGSIIVPDVRPDILKVLQVDAEPVLCEKIIDEGKLVLKGKLNVNVLYVPESENENVICIKGCFEFCETCKNPEFEPGMAVSAFADAKKVGYKLINSRKIGIEAEVGICVQVMGEEKCNIVCDVEDECAEVKKENVCISSGDSCREFSFVIEETMDFPETKARIGEILRSNIAIYDKEYRTISGKLVVKGKADISVLYLSEDCACDRIDFEVPFTEVFDYDELHEGMECDITFVTEENEVTLKQGTGGDKQTICVKSDIRVCVRTEKCEEIQVVTDCYFTSYMSEIKNCEIATEKIVGKPAMSCVIKEILEKSEGQPEISGIYTSWAKPQITSTQIQNGRIAVSGKLLVYVLYTSRIMQNPVCSINEEIPFSYMMDCESVARGDDVLLMAECEHISCTISSPSSVEIRCGLLIKGKVVKKSAIKVVCDAEITGECEDEGALCVYFVKNGDTVWDIAKHYHVKCAKIAELNNLGENAELVPGERIIIPL